MTREHGKIDVMFIIAAGCGAAWALFIILAVGGGLGWILFTIASRAL